MQWTLGGVLIALTVSTATLTILARHFEPFIRAQIVQTLAERFHTHVELDYFHITVHHGDQAEWGLWARGHGLRIWPPHSADATARASDTAPRPLPMIQLDEFSFHVPIRYEMTKVVHIAEVRLQGLQIHVPPRSDRPGAAARPLDTVQESTQDQQDSQPAKGKVLSRVQITRLICDQGLLVLETDKPDKLPLSFDISHLVVRDLSSDSPMSFEATLTNPKPQGVIHTTGQFGPWNVPDPGDSPVKGDYQFDHADMSTFKGLAGTLSSQGSYLGTLRNLHVNGETDTPDFQLAHLGSPMPLHTKFHARVDGTDGDTWLDRVDAVLGHSHFTTQGEIVRVKVTSDGELVPAAQPTQGTGVQAGHVIHLKVDVQNARIEDFMRLATHESPSLLTGNVQANAELRIPPGKEPVHMRVKLDGFFKLENAQFTSEKVQKRIQELSLRGRGHPGDAKNAEPKNIASQMQGDFHMNRGVIALPDLQYAVPGAEIRLHGTYALDGALHFDGTARMQATVSQMVGGWKGFLLKPVDRFFKKDGAGAEIPIKVRGTRSDPDFGLNLGGMKHTSPEMPGQKP